MKKELITIGIVMLALCGCSSSMEKRVDISKTSVATAQADRTKKPVQKNIYVGSSKDEKKAIGVPIKKRTKYLFPGKIPKKKKAMKKYLATVALPITDDAGKEADMIVEVHKKLADNFRGSFSELRKKKFYLKSNQVAIYNWRKNMNGHRSAHSFGCAVDILVKDYTSAERNKIKEIMNKHGFMVVETKAIQERTEYMHFSYLAL